MITLLSPSQQWGQQRWLYWIGTPRYIHQLRRTMLSSTQSQLDCRFFLIYTLMLPLGLTIFKIGHSPTGIDECELMVLSGMFVDNECILLTCVSYISIFGIPLTKFSWCPWSLTVWQPRYLFSHRIISCSHRQNISFFQSHMNRKRNTSEVVLFDYPCLQA